ncbi:MAG: hypothetical protein WC965_01600 [Thiohalomonadaceae bacterium]
MKTTEQFIEDARKVHGDIYDYSKVEYKGAHVKVLIVDPEFGEFWQKPNLHLSGQGHRLRGLEKVRAKLSNSTAEFVKKAREVHGDLYDYSKVNYVNSKTPVTIVDPDYGEFTQTPNAHLRGRGSPERGRTQRAAANTYTTATFIEKAREVHGDLYDYSKVEYRGHDVPVCIVDREHGEFWQKPVGHLQGYGDKRRAAKKDQSAAETFEAKARQVHGNLYDYSKVEYKSALDKVVITHPTLGDFLQRPNTHLNGHGHPNHYRGVSAQELILTEWLDDVGIPYTVGDRDVLGGLEVDILMERVGVEVDGAYWHSTVTERGKDRYYHQSKQDLASAAGLHLFQFFDTEVNDKLPIIKSMIKAKLGMFSRRLYARKTKTKELTPADYRGFLEDNHLQGAINSRTKLGLFYGDELVAVMGVSTRRGAKVLDRFATKLDTQVVGGMSKLLSNIHGRLRTHSANRYASGDAYATLGFKVVARHPYTIYFVSGGKVYPREAFQKHKLPGLFPDYDGSPGFLESKNIYPLYHAGTTTWEIEL